MSTIQWTMWKETTPVLSVVLARGTLFSIANTSENFNRFVFRDAIGTLDMLHFTRTCSVTFYAIRLYRHLLPLMHSQLKQCRRFGKKDRNKLTSVRFLIVQFPSLFLRFVY
jgi:hypothetical protein